jgi:membrane associated rhomboid family serine protease
MVFDIDKGDCRDYVTDMPDSRERAPTPDAGITPVIKVLLILNTALFVAEQFIGYWLIAYFGLWPAAVPLSAMPDPGLQPIFEFFPWQLLTYAFLHGSLLHLFLNLYPLWMFGSQIEYAWGRRRFIRYYLICAIGAGLIQLVVSSYAAQTGSIYPTIGASGAVFGILLAFGMMFPNSRLMVIFLPFPIKAKWFVISYGVIELWAGVTGTQQGVAHFAHLGGIVVGLVLIQYWRGKLPIKPQLPMPW